MVEELAMASDDKLPEEDRDLHVQQGDEVVGAVRAYELVEPLGGGGFSVVWSAKPTAGTPDPGPLVAIKFLAPIRSILSSIKLKEMRTRNFNEFRALLQVENFRVVRALDAGSHEGVPFIVLEYVRGRTLLDWLNNLDFELTIGWIEALMDELCEAVAALHETSVDDTPIVHRDLKPANVMILEDGEIVGVKVIDLGVAKVGQGLTSGVRKPAFTKVYAAPEQALDTNTAMGTWTDVFTLAVMLFHLGAEGLGPEGPLVKDAKGTEWPWHMFVIGRDDKAVRGALASQAAYLPVAVRDVMLRCLRLRTDLRPVDARALQRELRAAWDAPKGAAERISRFFVRSKRPCPALANPQTMVRIADRDGVTMGTAWLAAWDKPERRFPRLSWPTWRFPQLSWPEWRGGTSSLPRHSPGTQPADEADLRRFHHRSHLLHPGTS
jgi:serine/threonine protein kinase